MKNYNINYDRLLVKRSGILDEEIDKALFFNINGTALPKYSVLVFPDGRVSYDAANPRTGNSNWQSAIKPNQWERFYNYSRNYDSRLVFLNEYPSNYTGTKLYKEFESSEAELKYQSIQNIKSELDISDAKAINESNLNTKEIYHYPAVIDTHSSKKDFKVEKLLYFEPNDDFPEETLAAVTVDNKGAQYVAFFMAFGDWSKTSSVLNIVWLSWAVEKDFKFISGNHIDTAQGIKETSGSGNSLTLEILLMILSTIFTIFYIIF